MIKVVVTNINHKNYFCCVDFMRTNMRHSSQCREFSERVLGKKTKKHLIHFQCKQIFKGKYLIQLSAKTLVNILLVNFKYRFPFIKYSIHDRS